MACVPLAKGGAIRVTMVDLWRPSAQGETQEAS